MTTPLAHTARHLAAKWKLEQLQFKLATPEGEVYFATRLSLPVVLKVPDPKTVRPGARKALLHFYGFGAVRLLAKADEGFLMERVEPGTPLSTLVLEGNDDEATGIICDVVAELHKSGPAEGFPALPDWHDRYDVYGQGVGDLRLPAKLYKRAKGLYLELALSQDRATVLHGDLHHDNILSDHQRGWVAIDPEGYLGEPAYEFGCALRNPGPDPRLFAKPEIIDRRLGIITERTGLDRQRLLLWAFAQAVLSALWSIEDGEDPARGLATAMATEALL